MKKLFFCWFVLFFCSSRAQEKWMLDSKISYITYEASHFLHDWSGTNQNVKGLLIMDEDFYKKIALPCMLGILIAKIATGTITRWKYWMFCNFQKLNFFRQN